MNDKPTYHIILISLLLLIKNIKSQSSGVGCPNANEPCPVGEVRMNAIYNPSGAFIGGCNCVFIFCAWPRVYDPVTHVCSCQNKPQFGCPWHQIFNEDLCQCECAELHIPGSNLVQCIANTQPNPMVLPDCTCECWLPGCAAHKLLNEKRCACECPQCTVPGESIINEVTCACGFKPIVITTTTTTQKPIFYPGTTQTHPGPIQPHPAQTQPPPLSTQSNTVPTKPNGGTIIKPTQIPPPEVQTTAWDSPYCCQPAMKKFAPFFGKCWPIINQMECNNQVNVCRWDSNDCLKEVPICLFSEESCTMHSDCCSNICAGDEFPLCL